MTVNHPSPTETLSPQDSQLAAALAAQAPPNFTPPALLDPNYVPPNKGPQILAAAISITVLATIIVTLRLFLRVFHRSQKFQWDDYLIIPAMVRSRPHSNRNPTSSALADTFRSMRNQKISSPQLAKL
jgi:hypothetical protein